MKKYFKRAKYQTAIVSPEMHKKWLEENPQFKDTKLKKYLEFRKYWRLFIDKFYKEINDNPAGVDLSYVLGNISIKILDINFRCEKDFLKTKRMKKGEETKLEMFVTTGSPKKAKITWRKLNSTPAIARYMGFEPSSKFKKSVGHAVANRENFYEKAFSHDMTPSKCGPEPEEKSLFDIA